MLRAGDREIAQELELRKDPSSTGSQSDIESQLDMLLRIRHSVNEVVDLIDRIESTRSQIQDLVGRLHGQHSYGDLIEAGEALERALKDLEGNLFDLRLTGGTARQDTLRWPRRLYAELTSLAGYVSSAVFPPTMQELEVYERYLEMLADYQARMDALVGDDIAAFNRLLAERGITLILMG